MSSEYRPDRIDLLCIEFEKAIQQNQSPSVSDFLERVDDDQSKSELLKELLWIENRMLSAEQCESNRSKYRAELADFGHLLADSDDTEVSAFDTDSEAKGPSESLGQVGSYRIRKRIGEGGMGSVYLAEQEHPVKRQVALKVIRTGMNSDKVIARFEAERQAVALMNHPCIARILDAGETKNGQPYFAMELVEGVPLNEYCDHHRLSIPERLKLFNQVCEGVQHAHQKGIVHRDLKPSNILVSDFDGFVVPKIIDFGLAKALETTQRLTDKTIHTEAGQILGTLKYMSPEQAELSSLDVDTRSDIYTLGVILYELLTGTTPLDSNTLRNNAVLKALEMVREMEAPRPSSRLSTNKVAAVTITEQRQASPQKLTQMLSGDLDWIVMKAIEKDRERRYDSASSFAADIQRYLDEEPVIARPPTTAYRISKFIRKNRTLAASIAVVAATLLIGLAGTSYGMIWALKEKKIATTAKSNAEKLAAQKSQLANEKAKLADEKSELAERNQKVVDFFVSSFRYVDPSNQNVSGKLTTAEFLKQALIQINATSTWSDDKLTKATLLSAMGRSLEAVGLFVDSMNAHAEAFEIRNSNLGSENLETLRSMNDLAWSYQNAGKAEEGYKLQQENVDRYTELYGADHPETMTSLSNLALAIEAKGDFAKALEIKLDLLKRRKSVLGENHPDTLNSMNNLAASYLDNDENKKALSLFRETHKLASESLGPDHPKTITTHNNVAMAYEKLGQYKQAQPIREQVMKMRMDKLGNNHPDTIVAVGQLATNYESLGRLDKAIELNKRSYDQIRLTLGQDHPLTLLTMSNLASGYATNGDVAQAFAMYKEVIRLQKARYGENSPRLIGIMIGLAFSHQEAGRIEQAIELYTDILDSYEDILKQDHVLIMTTKNNLGVAYSKSGMADRAVPVLKDVLAGRRRQLGEDHPKTVATMNNLARSLQASGQLDKALPLLEKSLEIYRSNLGDDHPTTLSFSNNLGGGYLDSGQFEKAIDLFEKTLEARKRLLGDGHPDTVNSMYVLGMGLQRSGQLEKAISQFEAAVQMGKSKLGSNHLDTLIAQSRLADALIENKQLAKAIPILEHVHQTYERNMGSKGRYTLTALSSLAAALRSSGMLEDSLRRWNQLYDIRKSTLGASHSSTSDALRAIQSIQLELGQYEAARESIVNWQQSLAGSKQSNRTYLAWSQIAMAHAMMGLNQNDQAMEQIDLALKDKQLNDIQRLRAQSIRATLMARNGDAKQAETELLDSAQKLHDQLADLHPHLRWYVSDSQRRVVEFFESQERTDEVQRWNAAVQETEETIRRLPNAGMRSSEPKEIPQETP